MISLTDGTDYIPFTLPVVAPSIESVPSFISAGYYSDLIFTRSFQQNVAE
jgi:hypothetical protein